MSNLNLMLPAHSYFYGFALMDGSLIELDRGRGRLAIEIKYSDRGLLNSFSNVIPVKSTITNRKRDTNFKKGYESSSFRIYDKAFRWSLKDLGFPVGKKSDSITLPNKKFIERDFWRGVIDADGSLGFTSKGIPFLSLCTKSENIKEKFLDLIYKITKKKKLINRNKRDGVFNIMITRLSAVKLIKYLYLESCIHLERKYHKAMALLKWVPPENSRKSRRWEQYEIEFIKSNPVQVSSEKLNRSKLAILAKLSKV